MILHGRSFSAVLHGKLDIFILPTSSPGKQQITIQSAGGNSIIVDNQILDCSTILTQQWHEEQR